MPFARKGTARPHGASRRPRRAGREGAAPSDCRGCGHRRRRVDPARALDRPVVSRTDATTIRELRRLGGLLKKVHLDSGGAYSKETAVRPRRASRGYRPLAGGEGGRA